MNEAVCRGSFALGTACGRCLKCQDERARLVTAHNLSEAKNMTKEETELMAEVQRVCDEVNRKLKPIEDSFMSYVAAYKVIGYGRMIQLIKEKWDSELCQRRTAVFTEGDKGYTRDVP